MYGEEFNYWNAKELIVCFYPQWLYRDNQQIIIKSWTIFNWGFNIRFYYNKHWIWLIKNFISISIKCGVIWGSSNSPTLKLVYFFSSDHGIAHVKLSSAACYTI